MINIVIKARFKKLIDAKFLQVVASAVLSHENIDPEADLSIVIEDDVKLRQLNRDFLGIDQPTDVLAFPVNEIDPDTNRPYIGDIIISYPTALSQSTETGLPVSKEIQLLVIHGMLHLLGYDHDNDSEKARMFGIQDEIVRILE